MAHQKPKQGPGCELKALSAFARQIKADLKVRHMSQKDLAASSGLSEARISRILRDGPVSLTEQDINQLALGLKKSRCERDEMRYLAWPELRYIDDALDQGEGIVSLNCRLSDAGLPMLGTDFSE